MDNLFFSVPCILRILKDNNHLIFGKFKVSSFNDCQHISAIIINLLIDAVKISIIKSLGVILGRQFVFLYHINIYTIKRKNLILNLRLKLPYSSLGNKGMRIKVDTYLISRPVSAYLRHLSVTKYIA